APELILPIFEPLPIKNAAFWEQFTEDSKTRWKPSHATKKGDSDTARYDGEWAIEEVSKLAGVKGDSALVVKSEARHHAISARLEKPFDPAKEGMVLQYEVKLQEDLGCGGAYIKLLTAPFKGEFSDATPYTVMFGPDKCGESKVHLIFRHRNPISGDYTEHHLKHRLNPPTDNLSHLYSLAIQTNNTFTVAIDGSTQHTGSLLEDFAPPVNPPKEIDDPNDKKPADWEDDAEIPDPDAKKPEDWDEDAPRMIPDEDAVMPKDWLADEPLMVPDPSVEKPSDWDDDEDGEWSAPVIPNPRCVGVAGCGPWERPVVRNPKYKGEWFAPLIDNPRYKGEWAPRRISNPDYFEDLDLYKLTKIDAVGFELWTMQAGISFDNIYLGGSENIAAQLAEDVWKTKHDSELAVSEALHPK
ncbi:Calreticulin/calnexin, partial [Coemansia spiralis]